MPNSQLIFCQDCLDRTHSVALAVNEVNVNGGCSKCGSQAVMSADAIKTALGSKLKTPKAHIGSSDILRNPFEPTTLRSKESLRKGAIGGLIHYPSSEEVRAFLYGNGYIDETKWWDGFYFEIHLHFITDPEVGQIDIILENRDEKQQVCVVDIGTAKCLKSTT